MRTSITLCGETPLNIVSRTVKPTWYVRDLMKKEDNVRYLGFRSGIDDDFGEETCYLVKYLR